MFLSSDGPPTPQLHELLVAIATAWDEELLEFEADTSRIVAFWAEWGGARKVEQIDGWLRALEARSAAA